MTLYEKVCYLEEFVRRLEERINALETLCASQDEELAEIQMARQLTKDGYA